MILAKFLPFFPWGFGKGDKIQMINKKFYRLAYEYHERWEPCPQSGDEWEKAAIDGAKVCADNGNHPFLKALMKAVYDEMGRNYKGKEVVT